jgi:hypothetical protein
MKYILIFLCTLATTGHANEGVLLQRIVTLEKRIAELEERLAPVLEQERIKKVVQEQKALARDRIMIDAEIYQRHDLQVIEKLYQTAAQDWKSKEAKKAIPYLIERYPRANRTGCAILNRAQASEGKEQLELLEQAVGSFGNCYYANGVQVGAYARLYLAMRHKKDGNDKDASKHFEIIRANYANAVDHKGQLLSSHLEGMK